MKTRYFAILMAAAGFWRFGIRRIRADSRRRGFYMERNTSGNRSTGRWSWKIRTAWCRKKMKLDMEPQWRASRREAVWKRAACLPVQRRIARLQQSSFALQKQYLRDYYRIADKEPAYSTDDILLAVKICATVCDPAVPSDCDLPGAGDVLWKPQRRFVVFGVFAEDRAQRFTGGGDRGWK